MSGKGISGRSRNGGDEEEPSCRGKGPQGKRPDPRELLGPPPGCSTDSSGGTGWGRKVMNLTTALGQRSPAAGVQREAKVHEGMG